jgi:hypothetical protein
MGFFSRKDKIVDLTDEYRDTRKKKSNVEDAISDSHSQSQESSSGGFSNFFDSSNVHSPSSQSSGGNFDPETGKPLDADEKKRRLARRLKDMTDRIEEQSNQIYQMQQRIELLEKRVRAKNDREEL